METRATTKGQIVIPSALRRKYGIRQGTRIEVVDENGRIVLQPRTLEAGSALLNKLHGKYRGSGMLKALLEERARDREKEDAGWTPPSV
ncbi:MAG: AbrB/MazE/SpoVT family DNA-binding domain-containing protein [Acidobacteria bacterium]|nr:AbrB/MazE/SpoVT family DNA-binding domain-containing protein [Acidobacteriota bacterium]